MNTEILQPAAAVLCSRIVFTFPFPVAHALPTTLEIEAEGPPQSITCMHVHLQVFKSKMNSSSSHPMWLYVTQDRRDYSLIYQLVRLITLHVHARPDLVMITKETGKGTLAC